MASIPDKVQHHLSQLDKELSKYPALNKLENQTGAPKVYVVAGIGAVYFLFIFLNYGGQLLSNIAGFVFPAYYSLAALESSSKNDDTQWLTYWVVFALFSLVESAINVVYWFPFYFVFKFMLVLWLGLPQFRGAELVYGSALRPVLGKYFHSTSSSSAAGQRSKIGVNLGSTDKPHTL